MATSFIFNRTNISGLPCLESKSITENTSTVTFNFNPSPVVSPRFSGLIAIKISEQAATSADALPVYFNVPSIAGTSIAVTTFGGTAVNGVEMTSGIHLFFYDRGSGVLQLLV